ncbi:MAG: hypothetical protein KKH98_14955, partial [Spirochaetes bacterium]|nr:hypothetical protein [Spirochaetota bacterium]
MINIYTISSLLAFISMGVLGLFVYIKGRDRLINRLLALLNITIGTWSLFPFLTNMISDDSSALFWVRIIYIAAILCPTLFAHFSFTLLGEKVPIIAFYIFSGLLLVSLPTSFFMKGITRFAFHSTPLPG